MRATAVGMEEVVHLHADLKTRMTPDLMARLDWEAIAQVEG